MTDAINDVDFRELFGTCESQNPYLGLDIDKYLHPPLETFLEKALNHSIKKNQ